MTDYSAWTREQAEDELESRGYVRFDFDTATTAELLDTLRKDDTEQGVPSTEPLFTGHIEPEQHRSVGPNRAWCHACAEWCYKTMDSACAHCQVPVTRSIREWWQAEGNAGFRLHVEETQPELFRLMEALSA